MAMFVIRRNPRFVRTAWTVRPRLSFDSAGPEESWAAKRSLVGLREQGAGIFLGCDFLDNVTQVVDTRFADRFSLRFDEAIRSAR